MNTAFFLKKKGGGNLKKNLENLINMIGVFDKNYNKILHQNINYYHSFSEDFHYLKEKNLNIIKRNEIFFKLVLANRANYTVLTIFGLTVFLHVLIDNIYKN